MDSAFDLIPSFSGLANDHILIFLCISALYFAVGYFGEAIVRRAIQRAYQVPVPRAKSLRKYTFDVLFTPIFILISALTAVLHTTTVVLECFNRWFCRSADRLGAWLAGSEHDPILEKARREDRVME